MPIRKGIEVCLLRANGASISEFKFTPETLHHRPFVQTESLTLLYMENPQSVAGEVFQLKVRRTSASSLETQYSLSFQLEVDDEVQVFRNYSQVTMSLSENAGDPQKFQEFTHADLKAGETPGDRTELSFRRGSIGSYFLTYKIRPS